MTDDEYRVIAVPDVIKSDGMVLRGKITIIDCLRERRRDVFEQAKALVLISAGEDREFTRDEWLRWNALSAEMNDLDSRIVRIRLHR